MRGCPARASPDGVSRGREVRGRVVCGQHHGGGHRRGRGGEGAWAEGHRHHHWPLAPVTVPGVSGPSVAELCSCSCSWSGSGSSPAVADCRSRLPSITEPPGDSRYIYTIYAIYSIYSIYPPAVEAERVWSCQAGGGVTAAAHQLIYHKPRVPHQIQHRQQVEDVG